VKKPGKSALLARRASLALAGLLSVSVLTACGFQLRGSAQLPPEMGKTQLVIADPYSVVARRVRVLLEQSGAHFVSADQATAILEIPQNQSSTEVLTIGDNARVREYRISHTLQFRLLDSGGKEIIPLQTIRQSRDISFDEQRILALSREQEYIRQDLAETVSRMLVSRLEGVGSTGASGG
jgi:LPS-assembly lipoprotein